jgi:hypothetical protein
MVTIGHSYPAGDKRMVRSVTKISVSVAVFAMGASALAGCSAAATSKTAASTSKSAAPPAWTASATASVRQLLAMAYQGKDLDCAVGVITATYTTEDWAYVVAHPTVDGQPTSTTFPPRLVAMEAAGTKALEGRCGIKGAAK